MGDEMMFQNTDSWRGSGSGGKYLFSFKQILLSHVNRCVVNGSVEMHGGYWQDKNTPTMTEHVYVPDSRDVYTNSIIMLRALLLGYFDKDILEPDKTIMQEINVLETEANKKLEAEKESEWTTFKPKYNAKRIILHIKLFEELIKLCKRMNFLEEETAEQEV